MEKVFLIIVFSVFSVALTKLKGRECTFQKKDHLLPLLLLFVIFVGCNKPTDSGLGEEYSKKLLTKSDSSMVQYKEGDSIAFIHSSGISFYLTVDSVITEQTSELRTSPHFPVEEVEVLYTYLSSPYPYLNIVIRVVPQTSELHSSEILINDKYSYTLYAGYAVPKADTVDITLGSKSYSNVLRFNKPDNSNHNTQNVITIDTLFYSKEFGILQMGKSNGETYTINK